MYSSGLKRIKDFRLSVGGLRAQTLAENRPGRHGLGRRPAIFKAGTRGAPAALDRAGKRPYSLTFGLTVLFPTVRRSGSSAGVEASPGLAARKGLKTVDKYCGVNSGPPYPSGKARLRGAKRRGRSSRKAPHL